jgi:hypothetical protein
MIAIVGVKKGKELVGEVIVYTCLKCLKTERLEFNAATTETTYKLWGSAINSKLCLSCHCDNKIPELVECLVH